VANPAATLAEAHAAGQCLERSLHAYRIKQSDLKKNRLTLREIDLVKHPQAATLPAILWDKAQPTRTWRDMAQEAIRRQQSRLAAKASQDHAIIRVETDKPLAVLFISDWHMGSWGTDYSTMLSMTDRIKALGLHVATLGDMVHMAVKLRGVLEVMDNMFAPGEQDEMVAGWVDEIEPHILWSTWCNHAVERQELAIGYSPTAEIFKSRTVYHSGIGHIDLIVGNETYKIASSHVFPGSTTRNVLGGQIRWMREQGLDRELAVAGDKHQPELKQYPEGPMWRVAINCGTLQANSGYAKRYFAYYTHDFQPVVVFHPDRHLMTAYQSLDAYEASLQSQVA
jgi:CYTH domain-containing protein